MFQQNLEGSQPGCHSFCLLTILTCRSWSCRKIHFWRPTEIKRPIKIFAIWLEVFKWDVWRSPNWVFSRTEWQFLSSLISCERPSMCFCFAIQLNMQYIFVVPIEINGPRMSNAKIWTLISPIPKIIMVIDSVNFVTIVSLKINFSKYVAFCSY